MTKYLIYNNKTKSYFKQPIEGNTTNPEEAHDYGKDKATKYVAKVNESIREDGGIGQLEVVEYKDFRNSNLKKTRYVYTDSDNTPEYLTRGKRYLIVGYPQDGCAEIIDDEKDHITIGITECSHLGGDTWKLSDTES